MFKSIGARIAVLFLLLVLVPLVILGSYFTLENYTSLKSQLVIKRQHEATHLAGEVHGQLEDFVNELELISNILSHEGGGDAHKFILLKSLQKYQPLFIELSYIDNNGEHLFVKSLQEEVLTGQATDAGEILAEVKRQRQPVCSVLQQAGEQETLFSISCPIFFLNENYINGAVSAKANLAQLGIFMHQHGDIDGMHTGLFLPNGKMVTGTIQDPPTLSVLTKLFAKTEQARGLINGTQLMGMSPITIYGSTFYVVVTSDFHGELASFYHSFKVFIAILLLVFIASLLTGLFFSRKLLTTPLRLLSNVAQTIGEGDLSKRVHLPGRDEFSELAESFNGMAEKLEGSLISLKIESEQRKKAEGEATKAMQLAQQANEAKSMFLANMSHEIRTPINGVLGMTTLLLNSGLNSEQQYKMELVNRSINRLLSIISVILDFSKIEAGDVVLEESDFDPEELVQDALQIAQLEVNKQDIRFESKISDAVPGKLFADSGKIHQIILNLLSNAVKYSNEGEITVSVDCGPDREGVVELQFCVADNGEGIPEATQDTIFTPFVQGNNGGTTTARMGAGLGLAICEKFATHLGGKIWFEKNEPSGSRFYFTCECQYVKEDDDLKKQARAKKGMGALPESLAGISIYLAEDEFINQHMLSLYLGELDAEVLLCNNGQELLDQIALKKPDIILMDVRMPVMGGIEATRRIRATEKEQGEKHIPIIALTAHATLEFKDKCYRAGMDHYLTKPIELKNMVQHILTLYRSGREQ